jgi:TPR repeat protein
MRMFLLLTLFVFLAHPARAGFEDGVAALEREDYETAYEELLLLAEAGDPTSSWLVAGRYSEGRAVKRDRDKAFHFMRQAAEGGHPYAMIDRALWYAQGARRDTAETRKWLIKPAETSIPEFQFIVVAFYYEVWDAAEVAWSDRAAVRWMTRVAERGYPQRNSCSKMVRAAADYSLSYAFYRLASSS